MSMHLSLCPPSPPIIGEPGVNKSARIIPKGRAIRHPLSMCVDSINLMPPPPLSLHHTIGLAAAVSSHLARLGQATTDGGGMGLAALCIQALRRLQWRSTQWLSNALPPNPNVCLRPPVRCFVH